MVEEVIYISGEDAEDDSGAWDAHGVVGSLEQAHPRAGSRQRLSVVEGDLVRVERMGRRDRARLYVRPGFLDPAPERQFHFPGRLFLAAGAALAFAAAASLSEGFGLLHSAVHATVLSALVGLAAVALAWQGMRRLGRTLTFVTRHGRTPVFRVVENVPDAAQFRTFMVVLGAAIARAGEALPEDRARFLAEELKEHRRLANTGALSPEAYEAAKARILRSH